MSDSIPNPDAADAAEAPVEAGDAPAAARYGDREDAGKGEIFVYSLGGIIDELTTSGFRNLNTLLIVAFQVNPLLVGFIAAVKTIWDGLADPVVAFFSDNCNTRFGRRRPFILVGGVLMAVCAWALWQFMPDNENLVPNRPEVPEVYFSDRQWDGFGDLLLAYGAPDFNLAVEVSGADDPGGPVSSDLLRKFAASSIKTLSGETKALIRLGDGAPEAAPGPASAGGDAAGVTRPQRLAVHLALEENGGADRRVRVTLTGGPLDEPRTTTVAASVLAQAFPERDREIPVIERLVYFVIGSPEKAGLRLETPEAELSYNIGSDRAAERATLAAVRLGMMELLAEAYAVPYWRALPDGDSRVSEAKREAIRAGANRRLEREPDYFRKLLLSAGVKLELGDGPFTDEERRRIDAFMADFPDGSRTAAMGEIFDGLDVEAAASYHAVQRDPLKTREFKSIWAKLIDGFKGIIDSSPQQQRFFLFVLVMSVALAISGTLYSAPYYAQGIEIAPSYNGRTLVVGYRAMANSLIGIVAQIFLPLSLMPVFLDARQGNLFITWIFAPIGVVIAFIVFFGTRERTVIVHSKNDRPGFFRSIKEIGTLWEFWRITLLYVFMGYAIGSFAGLGSLLSIYYVFDGNLVMGASYGAIASALSTVLAILTIPVFVVLCNRIGKHNTLRLALGCLAAGSIVKYFCYNPELPELLFIPPFFYSPAIAGFYKVLSTMMGDVTDLDELHHGERREGMFGAVVAIILKSVGSLTALASGAVIVLSGFEVEKGVHQDPGVFHNMLVLFSIVPGVVSLGGFLLLIRYSLTRDRVDAIKAELARSRAARADAAEGTA
mgnify:CR=1 FL=1